MTTSRAEVKSPELTYETRTAKRIDIHFHNGASIQVGNQYTDDSQYKQIRTHWTHDGLHITYYNTHGIQVKASIFPRSSIFQVQVTWEVA